MRTMRRPRSVENFARRICASIAVIGLLALGGCGSEDKPIFGGIEEQQVKEAEELKNKAYNATSP